MAQLPAMLVLEDVVQAIHAQLFPYSYNTFYKPLLIAYSWIPSIEVGVLMHNLLARDLEGRDTTCKPDTPNRKHAGLFVACVALHVQDMHVPGPYPSGIHGSICQKAKVSSGQKKKRARVDESNRRRDQSKGSRG
jgi:hypothetical protein